MNPRAWVTLARGVVLESVRRKDLWVVAILGFLIMASAGALGFFGMQGLEAFAKDLAGTVLGGLGTVMAVVVSTRLMPEEIRQRTLYPLIARPITRLDLLIGKYLGAVAVTSLAFLILASLTGVALAMFGVQFESVMVQYVLMRLVGLSVVCAVGLALSLLMTANAAATMGFVLAIGSGLIVRALVMAYEASPAALQPVMRGVNALVPQYGLFDLGSRAANQGWGPAPAWVIGALLAYAAVYSSAMIAVGYWKFRRQAV